MDSEATLHRFDHFLDRDVVNARRRPPTLSLVMAHAGVSA